MIRLFSKRRSPLHAGQTRMAFSSSSITGSSLGPSAELGPVRGGRALQAGVERDGWGPAEEDLRATGIEDALALLAGFGGAVPCGPPETERSRQVFVQSVHGRLDARGDVDGAACGGLLEPARDGVGDVPDEDVIARLLAIAVDHALLTAQ